MSEKNVRVVLHLIKEYEALKTRGGVAFFDENDFKNIIDFYENHDQLEDALNAVEDALISHSLTIDFFLKKAELLLANSCEVLALEVLDTARLFSPNNPQIEILTAEAMTFLGQSAEALHILEQLKYDADKGFMSEILLTESLVYSSQEQHERAFYALKEVLRLSPGSLAAMDRFWACVELTRKYEESIEILQKIIDEAPFSFLAWYNLGHALEYTGSYQEAIEAFEYSVLCNEAFEPGYRDCAQLCFEMKHYQRALSWYEDMLRIFEPDGDLFLQIGQCHQHLGNFTTARKFLSRAMHLDHLNDEVYFHIGECFAREHKWKSAINAYQKALSIEDKREEYFAAIAEAYYQVEDHENAALFFKKAINIVPEELQYWLQYASFLLETGKAEEALQVIENAEQFLNEGEAVYCKIACLFALGKKQEAYYWLGEALSEYFLLHTALFELLPELKTDPDIISLIATYTV